MPKPCLKLFFSLILFLAATFLKAQDPISGIVNTYHKVIEIIPAKACVRVQNISGLDVNSKVMLVQMKGATINTTASSSLFGDTISTAGAGLYEIATVCFIIGDSVFMFHDLLNSYDVTQKVQLVQFSEHYSAVVTSQIRPVLWDSVTGLGGVIAISVDETLELQANINADTAGYSGGAFYWHNSSCGFFNPVGTNWAYDATSLSEANGAYKGESIANIAQTLDGGKGAPANGGGGGNNHNNSGGGGANLTAGGRGGGNWSSGPNGCATSGNMGIGGKALRNWSGQKIFLGGGGGAGHTNFNFSTTGGGDGGGIIFIIADIIIGNGNSISANGEAGANSASDGSGGGGAGGTVVLNVNSYSGPLNVSVNGGKGGDGDDQGGLRCFGGGGGGSGGVIYTSGGLAAISYSVVAGNGGNEANTGTSCLATPVPGLPGTSGIITMNYTYRRSTNEASYCELLLPVQLTVFTANKTGKKVALHWEVGNPELVSIFIIERSKDMNSWTEIKTINPLFDVHEYAALDDQPLPAKSFYRLKILEKDGNVSYSVIRTIEFQLDGFKIYPNPAKDKVFVTSKYNGKAVFSITDISGRRLWTRTVLIQSGFCELNLPGLNAGVYLLRFNNEIRQLIIKP